MVIAKSAFEPLALSGDLDMKRVAALLMFALALVAPQVVGASYEEPKKDKTEKEKKKVPVPEPATIAIFGAAASAAVARKLWRKRQRSE